MLHRAGGCTGCVNPFQKAQQKVGFSVGGGNSGLWACLY